MAEVENIHSLLSKYWGHQAFREKQEDIINSVIAGKDTLALLPTGGGKSICFQIPALMLEGICLVISPLIALMQDQVNNLRSKGIKALAITSAMSKREIDIALDNAAYGNFKFLYVSPERLKTELFQARLKKMQVNSIAVDEAHCISQWGYDFRPAYLEIAKLREQLPKVPIIALTATATIEVIEDIQKQLEFKEQNVIRKSFFRKNIAYVVINSENQLVKMLSVIDGVKGSGIIYVSSRRKTKEVCKFLLEHNISADFYHAGLSAEARTTKQDNWIKNQSRIIVSTNAFGMGIDKPNVRFVIHLDLPESLEAYFQEAGRAGRDEKKAYAVLLNTPSMTEKLQQKVKDSFPEIPFIKKIYLALANYFQVPLNGGLNQAFEFDIADFAKRYKVNIGESYRALHFLAKEGYISISENFSVPSRVHFKLKKSDLYTFQVKNKRYDSFIKGILRSYGGVFEDFVAIKESVVANNLNLKMEEVIKYLNRLNELEIIEYEKSSTKPKITYLQERKDNSELYISKQNYSDRKKVALNQSDAVVKYTENNTTCRSQLLLKYFGESSASECGICDVCLENEKLNKRSLASNNLEGEIKEFLVREKLTLSQLQIKLKKHTKKEIEETVNFLLDCNEIATDGVFLLKD